MKQRSNAKIKSNRFSTHKMKAFFSAKSKHKYLIVFIKTVTEKKDNKQDIYWQEKKKCEHLFNRYQKVVLV